MDQEDKDFLLSCKYAVTVIDKRTGEQIHLCLYQNQPSEETVELLRNELIEDQEFALTEEQIDNAIFHVSTAEDILEVDAFIRKNLIPS